MRPEEQTRAALWRVAGLERDPEGLRELASDPFPLARKIGAACLARERPRCAPADRPPADGPEARPHALPGPPRRAAQL